jgi:hypothetical protein
MSITVSNTKLSQGQIKGTGKSDLSIELAAVEGAIAGALGKSSYEGGADITLADVGGMIDGDASAGMSLLVNVKAGGHDITGAHEMAASVGNFATTHAGALDAASAVIAGNESVGGALSVTGNATVGGALAVAGTAAFADSVTVATGKDLTVGGNLYVQGSTTQMDSTVVTIKDNNFVIAKDKPSLAGGEGFSLQSDAGAHYMHWDASGKWALSDGALTTDIKLGGSLLVDAVGLHGDATNGVQIVSAGKVKVQDSFMAAPLDFSKSGEYNAIFAAGTGWADPAVVGAKGLLGLFTFVKNAAHNELAAVSGSVDATIKAEAAARVAADGVLQTNIDNEASARAAADSALQTAINNEVTRATGAEAALSGSLAAEVSRAMAAEAALSGSLAAEVSRAQAAESKLTSDLAAEVSRAQAAEATLQSNIDTEVAARIAAVSAEHTAMVAAVAAEASARATAVSDEAAARAAADSKLTSDLAAEVTRAQAAEGVLTSNLAAEVTRATAAEGVLTTNLAAEVSRAQAAEATLQANIDAEASARAAAVTAEAAARAAADTTLQGNIDAMALAIKTQAARLFTIVLPGDLAANSDVGTFAKPAGKLPENYDLSLNGQVMIDGSDFAFVSGKIQFAFDLKQGDVIRFREF